MASEEVKHENFDFEIYPNPVANELFVEFNLDKPRMLELKVYDILGRQVLSKKQNSRSNGLQQLSVDLRDIKSKATFFIVELNIDSEPVGRQEFIRIK